MPTNILSFLLLSVSLVFSCVHSDTFPTDPLNTKDQAYFKGIFSNLPPKYSLTKQEESIVIYKLFAPWCSSCLEEISQLKILQKKFKDDKNLKIILVSISPINSRKYSSSFPSFFEKNILEKSRKKQIPQTYIFFKGELKLRFIRPYNFEKKEIFTTLTQYARDASI